MKLKTIINREEKSVDLKTTMIKQVKDGEMDVISYIIKNLYVPINSEEIKNIIYRDFAEIKQVLISIIKITPIENLLSSGINKYYFNLILQYSSDEEILSIITKNNTIKEYYEQKIIISAIKKDFNK